MLEDALLAMVFLCSIVRCKMQSMIGLKKMVNVSDGGTASTKGLETSLRELKDELIRLGGCVCERWVRWVLWCVSFVVRKK